MDQEQKQAEHDHLLLFPFMAQGHLIPFLNLAKHIEHLPRRGGRGRLAITVVSTPRNAAKLRRTVPPGSAIHLAELPFSPSDHGLPHDAESTDVLPYAAWTAFYNATETLRPAFEQLASGLVSHGGCRKLCVVADSFLGWTVESARALGVPHRVFATGGAYGTAVTFSLWLRPPAFSHSADPDDERAVPDLPDVRVRYEQFLNVVVTEDGRDPMTAFLRRVLGLAFQSGGFLVNTVAELEPRGLELFGRLAGRRVWPVGPVVSPRASDDHGEDVCIKFLSSQPPASVVYVSFGSQNTLHTSQMAELAKGLEASGRPFIWVVRPPLESAAAKGELWQEWLPRGFEERVGEAGQGVVVRRWAPQVDVLAHASTGAFLSHCGWNSVLESLCHGVPVIGWPLVADQLFDSRLLEEVGVGLEVATGLFHGVLRRGWEDVKEAIETMLGDGEKGRQMRAKAAEIKEMMSAAMRGEGDVKGTSFVAMEDFLEDAFHC